MYKTFPHFQLWVEKLLLENRLYDNSQMKPSYCPCRVAVSLIHVEHFYILR